jgi:hypothetical protein
MWYQSHCWFDHSSNMVKSANYAAFFNV